MTMEELRARRHNLVITLETLENELSIAEEDGDFEAVNDIIEALDEVEEELADVEGAIAYENELA